MSENRDQNLENVITFTARTRQTYQRTNLYNGIRETNPLHWSMNTSQSEMGFKKRKLSDKDRKDIDILLAVLENRLTRLGFKNVAGILPAGDQIHFITHDSNSRGTEFEGYSGAVPLLHTYLKTYSPIDVPLTDPRAKKIFYHETYHFICKTVIAAKDEKPEKHSERPERNYTPVGRGFTNFSSSSERGVFDEGLPDLFALFCMEKDDPEVWSVYYKRLSFIIPFFEEWGRRRYGLSSVEELTKEQGYCVFRDQLYSYANRDFSIQKEWVALFGTKFVAELNKIKVNGEELDDQDGVNRVAQMGNFNDRYTELKDSTYPPSPLERRTVRFVGLDGSIIRDPRY